MRQCILWFEAFKYNLSVGQKPFALVKHFSYLCFLSRKGSHIRLFRLNFLVIAICICFWSKYVIWSEYIISEKVHPILPSHIKIHQYICFELFWTVFAYKRCLICVYYSPDSNKMSCSLVKEILWIKDLYFSQKQWFEHHQKLQKEVCAVCTKSVDMYNAWE